MCWDSGMSSSSTPSPDSARPRAGKSSRGVGRSRYGPQGGRSDPVRFSLLALVVAAGLSLWLFTSAFTGWFRCDFLIVDQARAPSFMCDGADLGGATGVANAADSVANALGLGGDNDESVVGDTLTVPGLSGLINGPLEGIRKIGIVMTLLLIAAASAALTWILGNVRRFMQLLRFDRDTWRRTAGTARVFLTLYIVMLLPMTFVALGL